MYLEDITQQITQKIATSPSLNAKIKFDFGDDGAIFVDGTTSPAKISHDAEAEADATFILCTDLFQDLLNGTQDPTMAFMTGKLKVQGSMGLAMKISSILED